MPAHDHAMMDDKKQGTQYTCTMHLEIISDKPGKCPKCGMELVPKEGKNSTKKLKLKNK